MMNDLVTAALLLVGASFLLLAGVGRVRMPDLFSRMQCATKASTLGVAGILLAVAVHFNDLGITMRALAASAGRWNDRSVGSTSIGGWTACWNMARKRIGPSCESFSLNTISMPYFPDPNEF
jgi:multisubunit Na+/H+ antiporter MnhG subunit